MGNIVNRVFDSSGPEGKVRGTPQQIIEKYQILARDAQLSNDRVAEQNFLQHAEHYARMLSEAQREMAREQENRQNQQDAQNQGGNQQGGQNNGQGGGQQNNPGGNRSDRRDRDSQGGQSADVIEAEGDSGLVETPEERGTHRPVFRTEEKQQEAKAEGGEGAGEGEKPAAEAKPRRSRGPRKPRKAAGDEAASNAEGSAEAAPAEQSPAAE